MKRLRLILLCLLLSLTAQTVLADEEAAARGGTLLWMEEGEFHGAYVGGKGDAVFMPRAALTRAEAASAIYSLLIPAKSKADRPSYSDVPENVWYYEAVSELSARGIMNGYDDTTFRPRRPISRAEFISLLVRLFPDQESATRFSDVPAGHWAENDIGVAADRGWISGYPDGTFRPARPVSRAEMVVILNTVLKRDAGSTATKTLVRDSVMPFVDVRPEDWFYTAVLEASTDHLFHRDAGGEKWTSFAYPQTGLAQGVQKLGGTLYLIDANGQICFMPPGFHEVAGKRYYFDSGGTVPLLGKDPVIIDGELYCQNDDGSLLTDGTRGYLYFGADGKYTTKNPALDAQVKAVLSACTNAEMTRPQRLRAAYLYMRDNCVYLSGGHYPEVPSIGRKNGRISGLPIIREIATAMPP